MKGRLATLFAVALLLLCPRARAADEDTPVGVTQPEPKRKVPDEERPLRIAVGMRGELVERLAPVNVWGLSLAGELSSRASKHTWFVPRVGVTAGYFTTFQTTIGEQHIFVRWSTFAADGSFLAARVSRLEAFPVLRAVGGYANASTPDFFGRFLYVRPYLTVGLAARARVMITRSFFIDGEAGGDLDAVRSRFAREDGTDLFTSGPILWHGAIGAGFMIIP